MDFHSASSVSILLSSGVTVQSELCKFPVHVIEKFRVVLTDLNSAREVSSSNLCSFTTEVSIIFLVDWLQVQLGIVQYLVLPSLRLFTIVIVLPFH